MKADRIKNIDVEGDHRRRTKEHTMRVTPEAMTDLVRCQGILQEVLGFAATKSQVLSFLVKHAGDVRQVLVGQTSASPKEPEPPGGFAVTDPTISNIPDLNSYNGLNLGQTVLGILLRKHTSPSDPHTNGLMIPGKIDAIKEVRTQTNMGLREAKDWVEAVMSRHGLR
jgi:hypothetical protein